MATPTYHSGDLAALAAAGAYFVLAKQPDKRAVDKGWQKTPPPLARVKAWASGSAQGNLVCIKPTSLDLVVVDCDYLPPETVTAVLGEPLASILSSQPGRFHLYYRKPKGSVRNWKWADPNTLKLGGDIRCSTGYAILWDAAAVVQILPLVADAPRCTLDKLPKWSKKAEEVRNAPVGARNSTLNEHLFTENLQGGDTESLKDAARANGLSDDEVDKTVKSAEDGANQAKLDNARRDLSLTSGGFADRLLEQDAERLLLAKYQAKDGKDKTDPYLLQWTGLWRRDFDSLRYRLERIVDRVVVDEHKAGRLTQKVVTKTMRMREKDAAEALGRLGVAAEGWADRHEPRLQEVVRCHMNDLDTNGRYIACRNGVVDLATGKMVPAVEARKLLLTFSTDVDYEPDARHWVVDALTARWDKDLADYVWALFGRMMWGSPLKRVIFLIGPPNTGKSSLLIAVGNALGEEEAEGASADLFVGQKKDGKTGPTPARAVLALRRYVYCIEAEDWQIGRETLKNAAGGVDTITFEMKYGPILTRPLRAQIFIMGNGYPTLDWFDEATVDRVITIPVPFLTEKDPDVEVAIKQKYPDVMKAILAKLVRFAVQNPVGTEPTPPETVWRERQKQIDQALGHFGVWLRESLDRDMDGKLTKAELWAEWGRVCGENPADDRINGVKSEECVRAMSRVFGIRPTRVRPAPGAPAVYGWRGVRFRGDWRRAVPP